jgi:hypothetical protein
MPKPTTATTPRAHPLSSPAPEGAAAAPLIGGALYAAIEIAAGSLLMGERAEAALFLAVRPTLLILAAVIAGGWSTRRRLAFYAIALGLAAAGETILVLALGAADPWREMLGGLAAGAVAAAVADGIVQLLRRWSVWGGSAAALILLLFLFFWARALPPYEALVLGRTDSREAAAPKPGLLLMTALPIVWGTGGAFDPGSRPAETYRLLQHEFDVRPIDALDPRALAGARLMLLAQPRLLAPEELVALDDWVRRGGRVLILTDPALAAAEDLPVLDVRRPPAAGLLAPLLAHWGVRLEEGAPDAPLADVRLDAGGGARKLRLIRPGRFAVAGNSCRNVGEAFLARCRVGSGEAILVADADLLTDAAWVDESRPRGSERHLRLADNPLVVADWLDGLAGLRRDRMAGGVAWAAPDAGRGRAVLLAFLPAFLAAAAGLAIGFRRQRKPTNLSTGSSTENNSRTNAQSDP